MANSLSGKLAIEHGFEEIPDKDAYLGFVYIKDEKKWIHEIDALKKKLLVSTDAQLVELGYDVEMYRSITGTRSEANEMEELYRDLSVNDGEKVYLSDGMYLYPDGSIR